MYRHKAPLSHMSVTSNSITIYNGWWRPPKALLLPTIYSWEHPQRWRLVGLIESSRYFIHCNHIVWVGCARLCSRPICNHRRFVLLRIAIVCCWAGLCGDGGLLQITPRRSRSRGWMSLYVCPRSVIMIIIITAPARSYNPGSRWLLETPTNSAQAYTTSDDAMSIYKHNSSFEARVEKKKTCSF